MPSLMGLVIPHGKVFNFASRVNSVPSFLLFRFGDDCDSSWIVAADWFRRKLKGRWMRGIVDAGLGSIDIQEVT